jgi:hypothetical protein
VAWLPRDAMIVAIMASVDDARRAATAIVVVLTIVAIALPATAEGGAQEQRQERAPVGESPPATPRQDEHVLRSGMGLTGMFAVLVATGAHAASLVGLARVSRVSSNPAFEGYRSQFSHSVDVCDAARQGVEAPSGSPAATVASLCASAQRNETLSLVGLGLGLGFGALGTTLLVVEATTPRGDVAARVVPAIEASGDGAALSARVTW